MLSRWKSWAKAIKRESIALLIAIRDPRTPLYARLLGICVIAYALSPIDLIPDPIPVLGYLDDLLIVPAGIWFVRRLIPADVLATSRKRAEMGDRPMGKLGVVGATVIVCLWAIAIVGVIRAGYQLWQR